MPKSSLNVSLKAADDIFSTEESRQEEKWEQVQQIPLAELFPFKNHPFKVLDDESIKDFDKYAKRYHIDYAIQKDLSYTPPHYMIYFKAQDTDALSAAFKEYSAAVLDKTKRPSVLAKLHDLAQTVANLPDKVRHKQEERGL